ncbi:ESX secretion-associated protein EspG [Mycobacterium bohemicum]|uniref:Secretion protein EspG n=1 Tax=Mycobacterium bohemicum TaxID=56425 RepID=A0A1X1RB44_MYCBE|nr:ESX secretion-associated protein EspG [Mycobacterium bohemicum]MCV6972786.1 ESX secretion-associated protein EspG [Mycobacterium bohemicum]ORV02405.1 secretion protein EspG [Mycobacterium bohemicum]
MLTTTIDGLWVLQAVTGVEQTCPELGLRPLLPRLDTPERALQHPVAAELYAAGALDEAGNADPMIREWLTVLVRRDLGLLVNMGVPGREPTRASICRFASWWVVLERHDDLVRLYPIGTAGDETAAGELVVGQIERLCGVAEAAPLRPVTLDRAQLLESVRDAASLRSFLLSQRLDADQLQMITMAADPARSAHAAIVALQAGVGPERTARFAVGDSTVAIVDTPAGRLCVAEVLSGQRRYQVISPGSRSDIAGAVQRLIRRLPAGNEWYSYRRVV